MATLSDFTAEWRNASPFITAHTSGSTGTPKEIRLLKDDMRRSARATNSFFGIASSSVLASPLSFDYIAGKMMAVRAFEARCRLIVLPVSNSIVLPPEIPEVDLLPVVPSQIWSLLSNDYASRVKNVLIGGAAPSAEQCRQLCLHGYNTFISYGMTETCSHVALSRADDPTRTFRGMPGIGFSTDADGRLAIIAPEFSFRRLQTNDVVDLIDSHTFRWRGRADGVINSGGLKLFPEELEALYAPVIGERSFYVCAAPHPVWGQSVALVIEGDADTGVIASALRDAVADTRRLPKSIVCVRNLPRTSTGKIRRILPW